MYMYIIFGAVHVKLLGGFQPRIPEGRSHQKISLGTADACGGWGDNHGTKGLHPETWETSPKVILLFFFEASL